MWYLIKSLFRYTFKNKLSTFLLTILLTISVFLLLALTNLSTNLQNSYNKLVLNGNLANIVINENYSSTYVKDPGLSEEQAKEKNEEEFKMWLNEQKNLEYRDFLSLDYTNTANKKIIKVISYDNSYTINKLVIYGGNKLFNDTFNFEEIIKNADKNKFELENKDARRELLYLASKAYWTDESIANLFSVKALELLNTYNDPTLPNYDPLNWNKKGKESDIKKYLKIWLDSNSGKLINKNYSLNFEIYVSFAKPKVIGKIINYASQFGVVPNYVLKNQNKKYIPNDWYNEIKKHLTTDNYLTQSQFENNVMGKIPEEYKIYVDSLPYIIVGEGITPDFMYPVYSFERITPNINEEVLLYTTIGGFNCSLNANRSNPIDSYIVAKYNGNVQTMVNTINNYIPLWMTTAGNQWAFSANDTSNTFQPCGVRLQFLPKLVDMQITISNILSIFTLILAITIFIIMLKKFISDNQSILAILRSNGYKKRTIIWSTTLFSLFPCLIGGFIGYILAFFTQSLALNLYSFYWVIPTSLLSFNPLILILSIVVPFLIFSIVSVVSSYFIIRKAPGSLMNESSKFTISRISKLITRPFPSLNIMTKFRLSVAFSSISRLLVLIIMISLTSLSLMFAFGTNNKFEETKTITYVDKKYKMAFDLETPTAQGGQYFRTTFENAGKIIFDKDKKILNYNVNSTDNSYTDIRNLNKAISNNKDENAFYSYFENPSVNTIGMYANNHFPSMNDASWQTKDINYLKNKIETQLFVDVSLGGTNAWDIARNLAPENVQNYSNKLVSNILQKSFNDENIYFTPEVIDQYFSSWKNSPKGLILIKKIQNKTIKEILLNGRFVTKITKEEAENLKVSFYDEKTLQYYTLSNSGLTNIKDEFLAIFGYIFSGIPYSGNKELGNEYINNFYKLLYNYVPMNIDDETYTYVNTKSIIKNNEYEFKVLGIKPDSNFIKLNDINGNALNDLLWINDIEKNPNNQLHDFYNQINLNQTQNIIINESAKYQYNLNVGDIIEIDPQNEATRYNPNNCFGPDINSKKTKFKVVGIYRSSQMPEFYINQRVANKLLNMDSNKILSTSYYDPNIEIGDVGYQIDPYNGFFTKEENHKIISNSLVLYTISGLGPANDKFYTSPTFIETINEISKANQNSSFYLQKGKESLAIALGFIDNNQNADYAKFDEYFRTNGAEKIINDLIATYGTDPYFSVVHNVDSISMYMQLFDNTSFLTNSLLIIIITIISIISILSTITIAFDLLNSSLAIASILKALGYSDTKNIITFTSIFIPSLIAALIISMPLIIFMFVAFKSFIYSFSNILLPLSLVWWLPIASLSIIGIGIIMLLIYAIVLFRRKSITQSIARY